VIRQRVNLRRGPWAALVRLVAIAFALALIYYGVMIALLALKLAPGKIDRISGYRTGFTWLAGLHHSEFTTHVSLIAGFGGLLVFLVFAGLVLAALPRPYLTRTEIGLRRSERGATIVRPRAIERIAEVAAQGNEHVIGVTGRLGDAELHVDVGIDIVTETVEALADVRHRVGEQLTRHHLPQMPIHVTLTGYERPTRRESS
jgi:hypothetical protein